jgi:hypothetical protein
MAKQQRESITTVSETTAPDLGEISPAWAEHRATFEKLVALEDELLAKFGPLKTTCRPFITS